MTKPTHANAKQHPTESQLLLTPHKKTHRNVNVRHGRDLPDLLWMVHVLDKRQEAIDGFASRFQQMLVF